MSGSVRSSRAFCSPRSHLHRRALATALACVVSVPVFAGQADLSALPAQDSFERFIVQYKPGSTERRDAEALQRSLARVAQGAPAAGQRAFGLKRTRRLGIGFDLVAADRPLDRVEAEQLMRRLAEDPAVATVEVDARVRAAFVPNDTVYDGLNDKQWHYHVGPGGLGMPAAWDLARGTGQIVAVIDSGGPDDHSDLTANTIAGYDFVSEVGWGGSASWDGDGRDADPFDASLVGHGVHVAGTIAALTNNGKGGAGIAFDSRVVHARVLGGGGTGALSDVVDAITWASGGSVAGVPNIANRASIINLSLGETADCGAAYQAAIDGAVGRGTIIVAAAGNGNTNVSSFRPANCSKVIAVAANDIHGDRAWYSNFGGGIDLTAPGGEICEPNPDFTGCGSVRHHLEGVLSTVLGGSYGYKHGTSMAAPHVAGVAALIRSRVARTPQEVEDLLKATARPLPGSCSGGCGAGIIDPARALRTAVGTPKLHAIAKNGGSSRTEVHALDGVGDYNSFSAHLSTAHGVTGSDQRWTFDLGDYNGDGTADLYAIDRMGAASTEVHVLNGADGYRSYLLHAASAQQTTGNDGAWQYRLGDYNRDGRLDLYAIHRQGASNRTEVHVLNGADSFHSFLLHKATALGPTGSGADWAFDVADYDGDAAPDLYAISKQGSSGKTEVHVLAGGGGFQSYLAHIATGLAATGSDYVWTFDLGDYNGDGKLDLYAIRRQGTVTNTTEVQVLDGNGFQTVLRSGGSGLHVTGADNAWTFLIGQR